MEYYDINIGWCKALVEVTLQIWEYTGHYRVGIQGNVKGLDLLETATDLDTLDNQSIIWNDCKLNLSENSDGEEIYNAELKDKIGNVLETDGFIEDLKKIVIGVQLIHFEQDMIG